MVREGYSTERRRQYRENEIAKVGAYEFNRKRQLAKAKRQGYLTSAMLEKYKFNSEELPFLSHAIWDDTGRCCDHVGKASLEVWETEHSVL